LFRTKIIFSVVLLFFVSQAYALVEDFSGPVAGTVIAGDEPGGGSAVGNLFTYFSVSGSNTGGGPQPIIIFDSANP
jgi:hypothetical protein